MVVFSKGKRCIVGAPRPSKHGGANSHIVGRDWHPQQPLPAGICLHRSVDSTASHVVRGTRNCHEPCRQHKLTLSSRIPHCESFNSANFGLCVSTAGTASYSPYLAMDSALDFREWVGGEEKVMGYIHGLAVNASRRMVRCAPAQCGFPAKRGVPSIHF